MLLLGNLAAMTSPSHFGFMADYRNLCRSGLVVTTLHVYSLNLSRFLFFFTSKWQILPDLCAERVVIRYNLPVVVSNYEDNKLVILLPRPGCFVFFLAPTST